MLTPILSITWDLIRQSRYKMKDYPKTLEGQILCQSELSVLTVFTMIWVFEAIIADRYTLMINCSPLFCRWYWQALGRTHQAWQWKRISPFLWNGCWVNKQHFWWGPFCWADPILLRASSLHAHRWWLDSLEETDCLHTFRILKHSNTRNIWNSPYKTICTPLTTETEPIHESALSQYSRGAARVWEWGTCAFLE